jgi:protein-S-isoprenylcysteine O-methyltransferase Ste14
VSGRLATPFPPSDAPKRDAPGVIAPPPLIYFAALGVGFGLDAMLPSTSLADWLAWSLGSVLILAGGALATSFLAALRRAHTPVDPSKPTTTVVTSGPYRLSRNPGYLAMALTYAGIAILTGALWAFVPLIPALILVSRGVIQREERYLEGKFGEEYLRYKRRTRRWL